MATHPHIYEASDYSVVCGEEQESKETWSLKPSNTYCGCLSAHAQVSENLVGARGLPIDGPHALVLRAQSQEARGPGRGPCVHLGHQSPWTLCGGKGLSGLPYVGGSAVELKAGERTCDTHYSIAAEQLQGNRVKASSTGADPPAPRLCGWFHRQEAQTRPPKG